MFTKQWDKLTQLISTRQDEKAEILPVEPQLPRWYMILPFPSVEMMATEKLKSNFANYCAQLIEGYKAGNCNLAVYDDFKTAKTQWKTSGSNCGILAEVSLNHKPTFLGPQQHCYQVSRFDKFNSSMINGLFIDKLNEHKELEMTANPQSKIAPIPLSSALLKI